MRKRSLFFIFVMLLASCSSFAQNPQSPPPTPTGSATQAPASDADADASWKTYTNAEVGFSIQYPANWQEQDLPDENAGQMHHIALQGPEGGMELVWGSGLGGACPEGYQPIAVAQGTLSACHTQREDGTELWSLAGQPVGDTNFTGFVYTNDTTARSREVVLQVISTLSLPNTLQPTLASIATETPASATSTGACPSEGTDLKLFTNADDGYCLLYPAEDTATPPYLIIINPNGMPGDVPGDAWVQISAEGASGRTAEQVADEQIAAAGAGFNITRDQIVMDGKQAVVVDGLPGPDSWRKVFIVANDHLYTLFFLPWAPNTDGFSQLEKLYSTVISSFHFLPPAPVTETTWKTYTNAEVGFSIQYPSNWQEKDLPDEVAGTRHHIILNGPEGAVELLWGTGLGGACPEGYQPITVANGSLSACHTQREDGTELWSLAGQPLENTNLVGEVYTNDATAESRAVVLQVISTLSFP